jgi:Calpain family cysteine protease
VYVIVDDKIPVKAKDGRPIFGHAKDPNELWVSILEKGDDII